jgi:hypothetical protein
MARDKVKSDEIDGFVYEVHQLPATKGEEIGAELVAMVLPMLGALAGEGNGKVNVGSVGDLDLRALGLKATAEVFADKLTAPRLREIRAIMAAHTDIYGEGFGDAGAPLRLQYDEHFAGRYDAMLEWFAFALEVNFRGFFVGLWARVIKRYPVLQALPAVLSGPRSTSNGGSGESSSPTSQH